MTAVYEKHGLRFMYPENWVLSEGQDNDLPIQITIESPSGGIWSANLFSSDQMSDRLLEEAITALREIYEDVEVSELTKDFDGLESMAVDTYFYCLDFMVMAKIQVIATSQFKIVLLYQAESRQFDQLHEVFRAMTTSLLQSF